ncbi:murein L,D-transpeptidase family protein [Sulfurimonas sp.]|uniref:L,D-transpeptidase family protein n=1 Tax=Sulfurimonas sp. TaxID=2022749 RepID=UPI003562C5FB
MRLIFLVFITLVHLNANTILDNYRLNGIDSIEKQLDLELTKKEYWDRVLKTKDTRFGYSELYSSFLICDKNSSTLTIYKQDANNTYVQKKVYNAFTGKVNGDKQREGDLKTPVGIYLINDRLSKETKLDPFYGPLAFVTNYPNLYDRMRGKNGSGIWLHGLPINQERDDFTKGCIAIDNQSIECLDRNIKMDKTAIVIYPSKPNFASKDKLSFILSQLYEWRYSWLYNDVEKYLSYYSDDFTRFDGMQIDTFKKYKTRVFKKDEKKTIIFSDISVIAYPASQDVYQVTFKEYYKSRTFEFNGDKTLIVRLDDMNKLKIFIEK